MKVNLIHNDNIKIFDDDACHLELEKDCNKVVGPMIDVYMAGSNSQEASDFKHKKYSGFYKKRKKIGKTPKKTKFNQHRKEKCPFKKNKFKLKCYNYGKKDYFARECAKTKKVKTLDNKMNIVCL